MAFSLHGLVWLLNSIAWGFLTFRFWQSFKRIKGKVSEFFFYFALCSTISYFIHAIYGLFFADNFFIVRWGIVLGIFVLLIGFAFFGYLIVYMKFPKIPAKFGFLFVLILAIVQLILNSLYPPTPTLEISKIIGVLQPSIGILTFIIIAGSSFPLGIILIQEGFSLSGEARIKSLGLGILCLLGIVLALFLSILEMEPLRTILAICWPVGIFLLGFLTQKPPPPTYVKKI